MHPALPKMSEDRRDLLIRRLKIFLESRSEIRFALLHGSFPAGVSFRDVDLALYLDAAKVGQEAFRDYELKQGVQWSADLRLPVDVRLLNDAPVSFRYHAVKGTVLHVREPALLDEFRARTWDEYCDFAPFARRYLREVMGG